MRWRIGLLGFLAAGAAHGETPWPPSPQAAARLAALRAVLADRDATPAARDAARAEMLRMILANPDAPRPKPMPARAAVTVPAGTPGKPPDVAKVVPVLPPVSRVAPPSAAAPPITAPGTGATLLPQGTGYVDPATGRLYLPVPGGYLDPATGRFVPKP